MVALELENAGAGKARDTFHMKCFLHANKCPLQDTLLYMYPLKFDPFIVTDFTGNYHQ